MLEYEEKTQTESPEELLRVEPHQGYRLWNSRTLKNKLQGSFFIIFIAILMFIPAAIVTPFITNEKGNVMPTMNLLWLIGAILIILIFVFLDAKDFVFRRKNSYTFLEEGTLFDIGYFKRHLNTSSGKEISIDSIFGMGEDFYLRI